MTVDLQYGRGKLAVRFPEELHVTTIRKNPMPAVPDPAAALAGAFEAPVGRPPLHAEQLHIVRAIGEISALNVVFDVRRRAFQKSLQRM